jgi:hypothetical protein
LVVNLAPLISTYWAELLGSEDSEYFDRLMASLSDRGAVALFRLQLRIVDELLAIGWEPPDGRANVLGVEPWLREDMEGWEDGLKHRQLTDERRVELRTRIDHALDDRIEGSDAEFATAEIETLRREVTQLRDAMASRAPIEQAKGVLMGAYGLSSDSAWAYLVRLSQQNNVKVREIADDMVKWASEEPTGRRPPEPEPRWEPPTQPLG